MRLISNAELKRGGEGGKIVQKTSHLILYPPSFTVQYIIKLFANSKTLFLLTFPTHLYFFFSVLFQYSHNLCSPKASRAFFLILVLLLHLLHELSPPLGVGSVLVHPPPRTTLAVLNTFLKGYFSLNFIKERATTTMFFSKDCLFIAKQFI